MPTYLSHFKEEWRTTYPWITNVKDDTTKAFCRLCNSAFSIRIRGEGQVKEHAGREKHLNKIKQYAKQTTIGAKSVAACQPQPRPSEASTSSTNTKNDLANSLLTPSTANQTSESVLASSSSSASISSDSAPIPSDSAPTSSDSAPTNNQSSPSSSSTTEQQKTLSLKKPPLSLYFESAEKVTQAEIIRSLDLIDKNISFRAADNDNYMFSKMFPDSKIAQKYQMHKSKLCYVVGYGLAPYYTAQLQKDANNKLYCFHFDETTTSQIKKQYDGYATYKTSTGIVTTYFGSLFVGRCSAVKLKEHMFDFLKKHELEISNLVSIGMDGPNVNLKFHREVEEKLTVDGDRGLLSVGSCPIHIANNGYNKLLSTLSAFINLDQFASDLHGFFSKSAAR